jgi:hypothetical protein
MTILLEKNTLRKVRHSLILGGTSVIVLVFLKLSPIRKGLLSILYSGVKPTVRDINKQISDHNDYGKYKCA